MSSMYRKRRFLAAVVIAVIIIAAGFLQDMPQASNAPPQYTSPQPASNAQSAAAALESLAIKGRAPKTGYARTQFGNGWRQIGACDTRNDILARDLVKTEIEDCTVKSGTLQDPYTAKTIQFNRGPNTSSLVQIDHVVALSDAWQKGAQALAAAQREDLANDPLELLAVDGPANQNKGDGDAATWLPPNKSYRCRYIARQIAVKKKYSLWVTLAEANAMKHILATCPGQLLPLQQ